MGQISGLPWLEFIENAGERYIWEYRTQKMYRSRVDMLIYQWNGDKDEWDTIPDRYEIESEWLDEMAPNPFDGAFAEANGW